MTEEPEGAAGDAGVEEPVELVTEDIYAFREPTAIGVSFRRSGKVYDFSPSGLDARQGDLVLAQTEKGVDIGEVVFVRYERLEAKDSRQLKPLLRKATPEDLAREGDLQLKEREARRVCEQKIAEHHLPMRLVAADYTFDRSRLTFFFSAERRVDFRTLVKDLAEVFRTRIELRQIGVRDQAKMIGGLGPCGRPLCCNAWLRSFDPVTIRVAKDQGLSLNPAKISGICDRLMCCLRYEHGTYVELLQRMPKVGQIVNTLRGPAVVKHVVLMHERVTVEYPDGKTADLKGDQVWPEDGAMPEALRNLPVEGPAPGDQARAVISQGIEASPAEPEEEEAGRGRRRRRRKSDKSGQPQSVAGPARPALPPRPAPRSGPAEAPSSTRSEADASDQAPDEGAARQRRRPRYRSRSKGDRPAQG